MKKGVATTASLGAVWLRANGCDARDALVTQPKCRCRFLLAGLDIFPDTFVPSYHNQTTEVIYLTHSCAEQEHNNDTRAELTFSAICDGDTKSTREIRFQNNTSSLVLHPEPETVRAHSTPAD